MGPLTGQSTGRLMDQWLASFTVCMFCTGRPESIKRGALCDNCRSAINQSLRGGSWPMTRCVFTYEGLARELIVRTKARGGIPQLRVCQHLFVDSAVAAAAADWCDLIIAAPPSFWSRVRFRPHLATELAAAMARRYARPVEKIITPIFWRVQKQALKSRAERTADLDQSGQSVVFKNRAVEFRVPKRMDDCRRILVVDDVRTSGQTLSALMRAIQRQAPDAVVRSIVMADAAFFPH